MEYALVNRCQHDMFHYSRKISHCSKIILGYFNILTYYASILLGTSLVTVLATGCMNLCTSCTT